eukprot:1138156-Pelagomonas_calceolata.AAC.3
MGLRTGRFGRGSRLVLQIRAGVMGDEGGCPLPDVLCRLHGGSKKEPHKGRGRGLKGMVR